MNTIHLDVTPEAARAICEALQARAQMLDHLLRDPSAEIIRRLCSRYYILQEYFVMRYTEARSCAVAALGTVQAALSFPL